MQKRNPFYGVVLFSVAISMMAGCASKEVVKKDDGLSPAPVAKKAEAPKQAAQTGKQAAAPAAATTAAASGQDMQKASSLAQLQSALEKIYFDFDSSALSASSRATLTKNAAAIRKQPAAKVRIEGNCDERGSSEYNLALGERRAKAAQQYLVTSGVKPEQLSIISYGKEKPAVQGSDETAMAKNRRDEFVVTAN